MEDIAQCAVCSVGCPCVQNRIPLHFRKKLAFYAQNLEYKTGEYLRKNHKF